MIRGYAQRISNDVIQMSTLIRLDPKEYQNDKKVKVIWANLRKMMGTETQGEGMEEKDISEDKELLKTIKMMNDARVDVSGDI